MMVLTMIIYLGILLKMKTWMRITRKMKNSLISLIRIGIKI